MVTNFNFSCWLPLREAVNSYHECREELSVLCLALLLLEKVPHVEM